MCNEYPGGSCWIGARNNSVTHSGGGLHYWGTSWYWNMCVTSRSILLMTQSVLSDPNPTPPLLYDQVQGNVMIGFGTFFYPPNLVFVKTSGWSSLFCDLDVTVDLEFATKLVNQCMTTGPLHDYRAAARLQRHKDYCLECKWFQCAPNRFLYGLRFTFSKIAFKFSLASSGAGYGVARSDRCPGRSDRWASPRCK